MKRMKVRQLLERAARDERGIILPLVLAFLGLGLLLITPTLGHGYTAVADTKVAENRVRQINAVDSGLEEGIRWLLNGSEVGGAWSESAGEWLRDPFTMNGESVWVTIAPTGVENTYVVTSQVYTSTGVPLVLFSRVKVLPGGVAELEDVSRGKWYGNLEIPDGGELPGGYHIYGNVFAAGDVTLDSGSRVTGGVAVSGDATLASGSKVNGTLCAGADEEGNVTLNIEQGSKPDSGETLLVYLKVLDGETGTVNLGTTGSGSAAAITTLYVDVEGSGVVNITVKNGTIDDVYIVGASPSSVTINMNDSSDIDDVWATTPGIVTFVDDTCPLHLWDGVEPPTPDCPTFPKPVADIETYEFS